MALKDKIRQLLENKGMKPADLARETGLSEATISYYLSGKKEPMGKTCFKLAAALGVSVDELLETAFAESEKQKRLQKEKTATDEGDGLNLSDQDKAVIERFKNLSHESKLKVIGYVDSLSDQDNE